MQIAVKQHNHIRIPSTLIRIHTTTLYNNGSKFRDLLPLSYR